MAEYLQDITVDDQRFMRVHDGEMVIFEEPIHLRAVLKEGTLSEVLPTSEDYESYPELIATSFRPDGRPVEIHSLSASGHDYNFTFSSRLSTFAYDQAGKIRSRILQVDNTAMQPVVELWSPTGRRRRVRHSSTKLVTISCYEHRRRRSTSQIRRIDLNYLMPYPDFGIIDSAQIFVIEANGSADNQQVEAIYDVHAPNPHQNFVNQPQVDMTLDITNQDGADRSLSRMWLPQYFTAKPTITDDDLTSWNAEQIPVSHFILPIKRV